LTEKCLIEQLTGVTTVRILTTPAVEKAVVRFYDRMYAEGRQGSLPRGILGRLFTRLQRFELHRVPATVQLLEPGKRLLDLGCGDGGLLALAAASKFETVCGVDVAPAVAQRAAATCRDALGDLGRVTVQVCDLNERLPFEDASFDAVTAIAVIEHIFDPYFTLAEIWRVLEPQGQLIIEVPNVAWLPRRLDLLFGRLPVTGDEEGWDGGHLHYFTFSATRQLLTEAGFAVDHLASTGIFPRIRNLWPSLLGGNILAHARKVRV
jgi:ubiquinone/menaquinone biosynthesis C-methylase UbiE